MYFNSFEKNTDKQDIRWEQRLSNYNKALDKLGKAVAYVKKNHKKDEFKEDELSDEILDNLIIQGLIQSFEYTHELAWNVMKDFFYFQGNSNIKGSRDAFREAFSKGLIDDGELWMETIKSRQVTAHTYNEETAMVIFNEIIDRYYPAFKAFSIKMEELRSGKQGNIFDKE